MKRNYFICLLALCGTLAAAPRVILKLDDLKISNGNSAFFPVMDYLKQKQIKAGIGVIAVSLDKSAPAALAPYLNAKNRYGEKIFEFWHHGLDHKNPEFKGTDFDYQKRHFAQADSIVKNLTGIQMHTFGAPYNAVDSNTLKVIRLFPAYKTLLYSNVKPEKPDRFINLNNRVNLETATGVPDSAYFVSNYLAAKSRFGDVIVVQAHPPYFKPEGFEQFKKVIDFLLNEGCEFVLPAEYSTMAEQSRTDTKTLIELALKRAKEQSQLMCEALKDSVNLLPRTIDKEGHLMTSDSRWWCSGFFPGVLWYLYENSGNKQLQKQAELYTKRVEQEKLNGSDHDIGFKIFCSVGNAYRITKNKSYPEVIETACKTLSSRYNDRVKCIRSWDFNKKQWQFPVIIDNMMNLEMMLWGAKTFKNERLKEIAVNHANTTLENHFRADYSCYHLVSYDTISGKPHIKQTHQGASDASSWARGQGWALYGYTFMYRETKNPLYLNQARKIAGFILHHPRLPEDKIPYWDFDAPNIPNEERDASAAALIASALIELSSFVSQTEKEEYLKVAEKQLRTLCSDEYLAQPGTNGNFILKHSVGSKPQKDKPPYFGEVDVPLTYADYYFLEALTRYKALKKQPEK